MSYRRIKHTKFVLNGRESEFTLDGNSMADDGLFYAFVDILYRVREIEGLNEGDRNLVDELLHEFVPPPGVHHAVFAKATVSQIDYQQATFLRYCLNDIKDWLNKRHPRNQRLN